MSGSFMVKLSLLMKLLYETKRKVIFTRKLEVDGCPSKEYSIFGKSALLMNASILFFPKFIYKFME